MAGTITSLKIIGAGVSSTGLGKIAVYIDEMETDSLTVRLYNNEASALSWGDDWKFESGAYLYDPVVIFNRLGIKTYYMTFEDWAAMGEYVSVTVDSTKTFVIRNVVPSKTGVTFDVYCSAGQYSDSIPVIIRDRYTSDIVWQESIPSASSGNTYTMIATGLTPPSKTNNTKGHYLISVGDNSVFYDFAVFDTISDIEYHGVPWGATAWGGITVGQEKAERVDITGNVMVANTRAISISGTVRVSRNATTAITGGARIEGTASKSITGAVRVEKSYTTAITGMARITATDIEDITGAIRIAKNVTKSITGAVDVNADNAVEITGNVMVSGARGTNITGTTNIDNPNQRVSEKTITGAIDILGTDSTEISGNAMVAKPFDTSIDGAVRVENARYDAINGIVCVEVSSEARVDGVVRIARDESTDITGTVQVIGVNSDSIDGSVKVERAQTATLEGLVQILKTRDVDLTGKVRIRVVTPEKLPETWGKYKEPSPLEWEKREKDSQGWREKDDTGNEPETWHYPLNDSK